ncbi:MAG TPA: D-alanine--D-alanine ligase [Clostridiales bacterium]|nr:D-alanine--D-alanine ligase [Clostridiales bacterium]
MEDKSGDVPLPPLGPVVGIVFNAKGGGEGSTPDAEAEYDSPDTIFAIRDALVSGGCRVVLLEADKTLPQRLLETRIDIAFNIAEGARGRGREAQVPALLNFLGIPFTGSDETALCLSLDKALAKRVLETYGIPTPGYAVFDGAGEDAGAKLRYPVIVKPNAEGSSKGIPDACIARSPEALTQMAEKNLALYGEPVLAETYIDGREFTVGILGNGADARVFSPMEIIFRENTFETYKVYSYQVKQDYTRFISYRCPAEGSPDTEAEMKDLAMRAYNALGCRDFARVDFRMDADGRLYFIEINPLPALAPGYSDFPMLAEACGVAYDELVLSVLRAGAARCGVAL